MRTPAIALLLTFVASAPAEEKSSAVPPDVTCVEDLLKMNRCQLLDLYKRAEPGPVPCGYAPGRMIPKPGKLSNDPISSGVQATVWQGKYFDSEHTMTNKQFGMRSNSGHVYSAASFLDGKPVHVIDYRDSWAMWRPYFDEFREVSPGIYLGITWRIDSGCPKFYTYFGLDARKGKSGSSPAK
jgi:hypothetical protein